MANQFGVKKDGVIRVFEVTRKRVNIPGFGLMNAEYFVTNANAIAFVMSSPVHQVMLREVVTETEAPAKETPAKPKVARKKTTKS